VSGHDEGRIELGERLEDEPPLLEPRMRHFETGLRDRLLAVEQEIEIERARALERRGCPVAAEGPLELEQRGQKRLRREGRLEFHRAVEEAGLVQVADRLRVAKARDLSHFRPGEAAEPAHRRTQRRLAVAEVRAEADEGAGHATDPSVAEYSGVLWRALAVRLLILVTLFLSVVGRAQAELVQFDRGHAARGAALARSAGGTELARELRIWRVPAAALPALRKAGVIGLSRPERLLRMTSQVESGDPLVPLQWWRAAVGADSSEPPGPGKPVTVVDSGVDMNHPEFANRPNTTALNTQTTNEEDEDHGTEVSSVVAAPANGIGIVGVYPEAVLRVWDASPFGFLNEGAAIQGIVEAARRGPGVINLSFGGEDNDPLLEQAILFAFRAGSLVVAAAGNEGFEGSPTNFPAAYAHVLTIGATNEEGRIAGFSTLSPSMDLAAPGVRIPVAEPFADEASGYILASGTSFSSPIVAGASAWVWTVRPDLDNTQLFEVMRRSSTDIGEPGFDHASGYGLLSIPKALAFRATARDPGEPNEDPDQIEPNGLFVSGTPPLTQPGRTSGSVTARVERNEDPVDLYRIWAPVLTTVRARLTGPVAARLLPRSSTGRKAHPLAVSKRGLAVYRNTGKKGVYVYIEVRPVATRAAEYTVRVTAARR
jgi:hypothetical protein